jgi:hypothetical protein
VFNIVSLCILIRKCVRGCRENHGHGTEDRVGFTVHGPFEVKIDEFIGPVSKKIFEKISSALFLFGTGSLKSRKIPISRIFIKSGVDGWIKDKF